jgi:alanine racemase
MGGGPVGCYLAYKLLTQTDARVFLFEGRSFERPQVIRIPFCIAQTLPAEIKNKMWCDEETRQRLFNSYQIDDIDFWPKPGYAYWPWIKIGLFQEAMIHYLQNHPQYKERFFFLPSNVDLEKIDVKSEIIKLFPQDYASIINNIAAIYCTCGGYAKSLRKNLEVLAGKLPEQKGHGIYLIYQNQNSENYLRDHHPIAYAKLGERGISYAASNNCHYDVQLYTYPAGELSAIFDAIPDSFIQQARYDAQVGSLDMTGNQLSNPAKQWFENYKKIIIQETQQAGIELPRDLTAIKIYYATRSEYYWNRVIATWRGIDDVDMPLFFLGDSAGSTDYKFGLSVGRGFLAVDKVVDSLLQHQYDIDAVSSDYQAYWDSIISREFNKGVLLPSEPWVLYQYLIKGRHVKFPDNRMIHYADNEQYENYLDEYQRLSADFYKTAESSSVLFVNTKAITENIEHIISFGHRCADSKIIGVVKSHGYGLGAKLISDLAIAAGIDFLAVAKLQEAVALRLSGIPASVRLMTFESPMIYDLSTYVDNDIEIMLPVSKNASSISMIEKWLQNKFFRSEKLLKIHLMVDTGLRRDGGHHSNLPESVLLTLVSLQRLDPSRVIFSGISTHLACYRCTDYKGEEVVNFRSLQFHRLHEVIKTLLSHGINIPMIHVGGGLALLAEQWPIQFAALSKEFNINLSTRVGHGLYGMELAKDLHVDCPVLRPVVQMELQVRHVFYVEEGEPVSYGGYWRAPQNGAWIATLSGGWAEGVPRTAQTLGEWEEGMKVSINNHQYPIVGKINMNAMMVNLGAATTVKPGDRAIIFGWRDDAPKLQDLAQQSGHISPSIMVNVPLTIPRIAISE